MTTVVEIVRNFYAALRSGDAARVLGLMSDDIEWVTMWRYKVVGRGPDKVAEGVLMPLMKEWKSFEFIPNEFTVDGDSVVSLGPFCRGSRRYRQDSRCEIRPCVDGR